MVYNNYSLQRTQRIFLTLIFSHELTRIYTNYILDADYFNRGLHRLHGKVLACRGLEFGILCGMKSG